MDELANNLLVPGWSDEPPRQSPLRNVTAVDCPPSNPGGDMAKYLEKPLPEVPWGLPASELNDSQRKQNLSSQTRNPRVIRKGERQFGRPKISHPVPLLIEVSSNATLSPDVGIDQPRSPNMLKRSMTQVENLSSKINLVTDQATVQEGEQLAKGKGSAGVEKASLLSPLHRGRQAIAKASRAIAGKISRSSSTSRMGDKKLAFSTKGDSTPGSSHGSIPSLRPNTDDDLSWGRHDRRIAEGENLGRPKIQAMIGDVQMNEGQIRRKPLPLQESIKSRSPSSSCHKKSAPSLVSGKRKKDDSPQKLMSFEFETSRPDSRNSSDGGTSSHFDHLQIDSGPKIRTLPQASRKSMDYLVVNGLAQHPNTLVFASPPRGPRTPKTRLNSQATVNSQRRVLSSNKSIIGLEDRGEDDGSAQASLDRRSRATSNGNMSVKRKSASRDLRSQLSLAMKRTKRGSGDSHSSKGDSILGAGTGQQDRADRSSFIARERNRLSLLFNSITGNEPTEAEKQGPSIVDVSKENQPIPFAENKAWVPQGRGSGGKKSSNHRRTSLFSRESRTQTQLIDMSEGDDMAIDELQTDDQAYQVGEKRSEMRFS